MRPRPPSQGSLFSGSTLAKGQKPPQNLRASEGAQRSRVEGSGWGGDLGGQTGTEGRTVSEHLPHRFCHQVRSHLHMFILIGDDQAHDQLPSTLFLRLLQLAIASTDRYEPWDQDSLVAVAQHHLKGAQSPPLDDGEPSLPVLNPQLDQLLKRTVIWVSLSL